MKTVYNNIIPFKGFSAINLFGILFVRNGVKMTERAIQHESIHSKQMKELLWVGFYLWYIIEWVIRLFWYGFNKQAYYNISFEREAYANEKDSDYLTKKKRPSYAFLKYLRRE